MKSNRSSSNNSLTIETKSISNCNRGVFSDANFLPLFKKTYELNNDPIIIYSADDRLIVDVNQSFINTFEFSKEEVIKSKTIAFNLFKDESELESICDVLQEYGFIRDYAVFLKTKSKEVRTILFSAEIEVINNESYILCRLNDITSQKKVEKVLRKHREQLNNEVSEKTSELNEEKKLLEASFLSEKMYADMVRNAPIGIGIGYEDGTVDKVNKAFSDMLGYTIEELEKIDWLNTLTPENWREFEANKLNKLSPENNYVIYEKEYIHKSGRLIPVELKVTATFDENNKLINYTGFISDISEKKLSQKSLNDISEMVKGCFNEAKHPIASTRHGIIYDVNQAFCNLFGFDNAAQAYQKSVFDLFDISEHDVVRNHIKLKMKGEKAPKNYKALGINKNKDTFPLEVNISEFIKDGKRFSYIFFKDLTEIKFFESKLHESENKYHELVENAVVGISATTFSGKIIYANQAYANLFGYQSVDDVLNNKDHELYNWKIPANRKRLTRILKRDGYVRNYDIELVSQNGRVLNIMFSATVSNDLIYGMFMNITKEKVAEKLIKESEEKYRALYDNALVALLRTNIKDGLPIEVNNAAALLFGYSSIQELKLNFKIDDHFIDPKRNQIYKDLFRIGSIDKIQLGWIKKDESDMYLEASAKINKERGYIDWVLIDITDRVIKNEQNIKLSKAIEQSPECIAVTDRHGTIEYANKRFTELTGYSKEELIGSNPKVLKSGFHDKAFYKELWGTINAGNVWKGEMYNKKKNGDFYWENVSIAPIINGNGITHFVAVKEDITDKKKMILDLQKSKEKAEESDRLKSAFLANMSHEIRTPMNGILGFTNLLKDNNLSGEEQQEYIEIIEESGERMLNTIQDIIDISKIETNDVTLKYSDVNLNQQVHYLYDFFNLEAKKKGLHLSFKNGLTDLQATIKTDKQKITSIFTNLVKNAIKYTNEGGIEFGYHLKSNKTKKELEIFVKDTGIGIAQNKQNSIFERFVQADIGDSRVYEGSGLGLSITKAYVEMLNGKIWVESEEGKGSQFYVSIPYDNVEEVTEEISIADSSNEQEPEIEKLKILIADDENLVKVYLGIILKDLNKEIIYANNGLEAIEKFSQNPDIDLILMDIKMPEMDGLEATRKIRELNKDVYIIIQTAFAELKNHDKAIESGANNYITKPIEKKKLIKIIKQVFSNKKPKTEISRKIKILQ